MNLRETQIAALRVGKVLELLKTASSRRLSHYLNERGREARDANEDHETYDRGFNAGLNAGLECYRLDLQDLDADQAVAAVNALPDD